MKTERPVKMIFRTFKEGDTIALMPEIPSSCITPHECESFMHLGQHGGASLDLIHNTRPATPEEIAMLKGELESLPYSYRIDVRKRITPQMNEVRHKEWKRMMKN